jgi:hypothetical protein
MHTAFKRSQAKTQVLEMKETAIRIDHHTRAGLVFRLFIMLIPFQVLAQEQATVASAAPNMGSTLEFGGTHSEIVTPGLGTWNISAVASALALTQTNAVAGNPQGLADIDNAQLMVQKDTGLLQFYVQAGMYALPTLGLPYQRANKFTIDNYGYVPLAYVALAPSPNWSIMVGKLNTMGGNEGTFDYQNENILRGLLWNQTSSVSNGIQVNHTNGPLSLSLSWNDGFYSHHYNWLSASGTYKIDSANNFTLAWNGSLSPSDVATSATPLLLNNSQIFSATYNYDTGPWSIEPSLQYTYVPANSTTGVAAPGETRGAALMASYKFGVSEKSPLGRAGKISLPVRIEYITSNGSPESGAPNLLYGAGSSAWSLTVTPTYQTGIYFARAEASYVKAINTAPGSAFGSDGTKNGQFRLLLEVGILY